MRGIVFLGNRKLEIQEFPDPTPGPGEVVLEMKASGMCGSDLHPYRAAGNAAAALGLGAGGPVIAGHEPCGVVAAVGVGVDSALVGQRVMNHHYKGCGACRHCRLGWSQLCRAGITVYGMTGHGGHARYMKAPAFTCVPLPEELSFEEGASVSCGTGTAYGALKRIDVSGRDTLAVFGQGPVGLSATMLGRAMGARVIAVDVLGRRPGRMRALRRRPRDPPEAAAHAPLPAGPGGRSLSSVRYANDRQGRVPVLNGGPRHGPPNPPAFGASRRSRVAPLNRVRPRPSERPGEAGSLL